MSISCQQIRLSHLVGPVAPRVDPPRSVVNGARRNLFGTTPEECNIDGVLARLQRRELQRVKATYNYDILDMERREQEEAEVKGVRFPYADSSSSAPDQSHHKVHRPSMGAGVSISSQQISASIRKISQKDSSDSADKRHGQKPYAVPQPQGLKRKLLFIFIILLIFEQSVYLVSCNLYLKVQFSESESNPSHLISFLFFASFRCSVFVSLVSCSSLYHLNFNPLSHPYFRLSETTLVRPPSIDRFQFVALPISLLRSRSLFVT